MKPGNKHLFLAKAAFSYCLVTLISFFVWGQQGAVSFSTYSAKNNLPAHYQILSSSNSHSVPQLPASCPYGQECIAEELELSEENESVGHSDFEWIALFQDQFSEKDLYVAPSPTLFEHLTLSISSRSTVSLFILYHSWKSFLV